MSGWVMGFEIRNLHRLHRRSPRVGHGACSASGMTASAPSELETTELDIKNILLVDDDVDLAQALKGLLEAHNFLVTTAANGAQALREVMEMDFDVIICDMLMPQMPGDMFYLAVQKTKPELCRRFLFITGYGDNPKVESFLKSNDGLVMHKPVMVSELVRMISLVMKRSSARTVAE